MNNTTIIRHIAEGMPPAGGRGPLPNDILGIPTFFLWNLLFIIVLALIFYWLLRSSRHPPEKPLDLLKKRYVAGEISKEQYEEMKKDISD
jgi:putative membrane protein